MSGRVRRSASEIDADLQKVEDERDFDASPEVLSASYEREAALWKEMLNDATVPAPFVRAVVAAYVHAGHVARDHIQRSASNALAGAR